MFIIESSSSKTFLSFLSFFFLINLYNSSRESPGFALSYRIIVRILIRRIERALAR